MKTISKFIENELVIKKSKFITKLYRINNEEEIKQILGNLKKQYKDCTHICYAYVIDNVKRFNDDKEPSGTAGIPILKLIEINNLNFILCVVIRYFGGIKLGAGGLIHAYSDSVKEALNLAEIIELKKGKRISIEFSYDKVKIIDSILKDFNIISKQFNENIVYELIIQTEKYNSIANAIKDICIINEKGITLF